MAQPPLSRSIKQMEDDLGTPLFLRTPKGVELTPAGATLLADAPSILAQAQRAKERLLRAGQGLTGQLDVGIYGSGILDVIPRILSRFHKARPDVRIVLHSMTKATQLQALRERKITIGFNRLVQPEEDLIIETVMREPLVVALPEGHPLTSAAVLRLSDLNDKPLILYPNTATYGMAQQVIEAFRRDKLVLRVEQEVEDMVTAVALVASGFGFAITTQSGANLRLPGVTFRSLDARHLRDIELSCIYRRDDASAPVLSGFLDVLRATVTEVS